MAFSKSETNNFEPWNRRNLGNIIYIMGLTFLPWSRSIITFAFYVALSSFFYFFTSSTYATFELVSGRDFVWRENGPAALFAVDFV